MTESASKPKYRINAVSKKTGILPVTLRAWERRYQILTPKRENNSYRLYSDEDIELLRWLKNKLDTGVSISQAAAELKANRQAGIHCEPLPDTQKPAITVDKNPADMLTGELYHMLIAHNEIGATGVFDQAAASLSLTGLFENVVIPVLVRIGEEWYQGRLLVATEHFASNFLRSRLLSIFQKIPIKRAVKRILIGGAPGEMHELGMLMLAILLRQRGFNVEFLGADIPLHDLVDYTAETEPNMVILAATSREAAEALTGFKFLLDQIRRAPLFGFGGGAYNYFPEMIPATPGIFLGKSLSESITTVDRLLKQP